MNFPFLNNLKNEDKDQAIKHLISNSMPSHDFFILISLSILLATLGLLINNITIIIGSMLVTPLIYPLLSLSLGMSILDFKLIIKSLYTIIKSVAIGIILATIITIILGDGKNYLLNPLINQTEINFLIYFIIALISGFAASFSMIKPKLNERLTGVAISVALIPPISIIGIGMAQLNWETIRSSLIILSLNIIGIVLSSTVTFISMKLNKHKSTTAKAIKKEEKIIEKES
ncbi:TIGR00341 family protein [bacterium]|nr:TIGR00341 family protein [bacterium]